MNSGTERSIHSRDVEDWDPGLSHLVPRYSYWAVEKTGAGTATNKQTEFIDGCYLENTGIVGMLAQTGT